MSSDLLREFGSSEVSPGRADANQSSATKAPADEDDFGDFEEAKDEDNVTQVQGSSPPSNAVKYLVDLKCIKGQASTTDEGSQQPYIHTSTTKVQTAPSNDDDWGDFSQRSVMFDADVEATRQKKEADGTLAYQHRSGEPMKTPPRSTTTTRALTPASPIPARNGSQGSKLSAKRSHTSSRDDSKHKIGAESFTTLEQPTLDDEPWVDFEAAEAASPSPKPSSSRSPRTFKTTKASNLPPPPSNIPPPSILLPIIATIFRSLPTNLKTIQSLQPLDQPSTLSQLHTLLSTTRAAARILAGRKLRWKRDRLLSQSMKIGPAHSGKAGGMKLAGLDKAETRREDQEAAEALQIWKQQAGPLRSVIVALNGQLPERERFRIAEIADTMPIRQGKPSEGMVSAPRCCFLCGIRRDERVAKVDVDVEDSFGEWWVEHWGHVDCVAFWENHKDALRQR